MNKLFILLVGIIMFCSCSNNEYKKYPKSVETSERGVELTTLSVDGDTCEFITYTHGMGDYRCMGMSHWTKCKYCAARNTIKQNEIHVLTRDAVPVTVYYTGKEISVEKTNRIRIYFHNYLINDVNTEDFEDNFYDIFRLENCKFDYNISNK